MTATGRPSRHSRPKRLESGTLRRSRTLYCSANGNADSSGKHLHKERSRAGTGRVKRMGERNISVLRLHWKSWSCGQGFRLRRICLYSNPRILSPRMGKRSWSLCRCRRRRPASRITVDESICRCHAMLFFGAWRSARLLSWPGLGRHTCLFASVFLIPLCR